MLSALHLLQVFLQFRDYKFALLSIATAFVVTMICIPIIIKLVVKFGLTDKPNTRKLHSIPVPTMGGVAIVAGMLVSLLLWMPFSNEASQICFYFCIVSLMCLGMMDDIKDLSARYKLVVQFMLATMIAVAGIRINSFQGLFGINELPIASQYVITVIAIVGITNAFNLIDGIDGLAGAIGFMSLIMLGMFLTFSGDGATAIAAFALAGAILGFLYFNFNPAKIFMGDTGSLVLGFVIAVLSIRLLQVNVAMDIPVLHQGPVFILGIAFIPVADTLRVFIGRMWRGRSPFNADKTHIHHLLTNNGYSHAVTTRVICLLHAFILMETFWLKTLRQEYILAMLVIIMITATALFRNHRFLLLKENR